MAKLPPEQAILYSLLKAPELMNSILAFSASQADSLSARYAVLATSSIFGSFVHAGSEPQVGPPYLVRFGTGLGLCQ